MIVGFHMLAHLAQTVLPDPVRVLGEFLQSSGPRLWRTATSKDLLAQPDQTCVHDMATQTDKVRNLRRRRGFKYRIFKKPLVINPSGGHKTKIGKNLKKITVDEGCQTDVKQLTDAKTQTKRHLLSDKGTITATPTTHTVSTMTDLEPSKEDLSLSLNHTAPWRDLLAPQRDDLSVTEESDSDDDTVIFTDRTESSVLSSGDDDDNTIVCSVQNDEDAASLSDGDTDACVDDFDSDSTPADSPWSSFGADCATGPDNQTLGQSVSLALGESLNLTLDADPSSDLSEDTEQDLLKDGVVDGLTFVRSVGSCPDVLGRGAFGTVYKAHLNHQAVAVKLTRVTGGHLSEGDLLQMLPHHTHVIELAARFVRPPTDGVVMARAEATIQDILDHMSQNRDYEHRPEIDSLFSRYVACSVAGAIDHIHGYGVLHLDIKACNVMLDGAGVPKLVDFSSALCWRVGDAPLAAYPVGTEGYQAPEIMEESGYTAMADWFSLGVLMYHMTSGRLPWGRSQMEELQTLYDGHVTFSDKFDVDSVHVIKQLLCITPSCRLGQPGLKSLHQAAYFTSGRSTSPPDSRTLRYAKAHVFNQ